MDVIFLTQGQYNKTATCPFCGKGADGATGDRTPKEDDLVICFYCGEIGIYTKELLIRRPKFKEYREIKVNDNIQRQIKFVKELIKARKNDQR